MLVFEDRIGGKDQPKDARMEFRTTRNVKKTIQAAAALIGVDDSTFAMNAAYRAALEAINTHERTTLSPEERAAFFEALDRPAPPTDALREAFTAHDRLIKNAG